MEDGWQRVVMHSDNKDGIGEDIFRWVVDNGWMLKELHEEKASLEDVFRSLTIGE